MDQKWPATRGVSRKRRIYYFLCKFLMMCYYNMTNG